MPRLLADAARSRKPHGLAHLSAALQHNIGLTAHALNTRGAMEEPATKKRRRSALQGEGCDV